MFTNTTNFSARLLGCSDCGSFGGEMQASKAGSLAQLAQVLVQHFPVARLALELGFIVANPLDEVPALLKFAVFVEVIEIG